jgi:hypothetical protein
METDVVLLKNIDNVPHPERSAAVGDWDRILVGFFWEVRARVRAWRRRLTADADPSTAAAAAEYLRRVFFVRPPQGGPERRRSWLTDFLSRPLRVCGMVKSRGEPGGGPFWVRTAGEGETLRIVESPEVDFAVPGQAALFRASTHFNPVHMALGLRDENGRPYDLARYRDPRAYLVTEKFHGGRPVRVIEHPGLWNGGMAGWITVLVEEPADVFHPVKTLTDLLRPGHQPRRRRT